MLAAAALGALGAQLEQLQAAKHDWFVGASLVDEQDISLEADGAVTVRRQAFDKALRNFPKTDSPSKAKATRLDARHLVATPEEPRTWYCHCRSSP